MSTTTPTQENNDEQQWQHALAVRGEQLQLVVRATTFEIEKLHAEYKRLAQLRHHIKMEVMKVEHEIAQCDHLLKSEASFQHHRPPLEPAFEQNMENEVDVSPPPLPLPNNVQSVRQQPLVRPPHVQPLLRGSKTHGFHNDDDNDNDNNVEEDDESPWEMSPRAFKVRESPMGGGRSFGGFIMSMDSVTRVSGGGGTLAVTRSRASTEGSMDDVQEENTVLLGSLRESSDGEGSTTTSQSVLDAGGGRTQ